MAYQSSEPLVTTHHKDGEVFLTLKINCGWSRSLATEKAQTVADLFGFETWFQFNGKAFSVSPFAAEQE